MQWTVLSGQLVWQRGESITNNNWRYPCSGQLNGFTVRWRTEQPASQPGTRSQCPLLKSGDSSFARQLVCISILTGLCHYAFLLTNCSERMRNYWLSSFLEHPIHCRKAIFNWTFAGKSCGKPVFRGGFLFKGIQSCFVLPYHVWNFNRIMIWYRWWWYPESYPFPGAMAKIF